MKSSAGQEADSLPDRNHQQTALFIMAFMAVIVAGIFLYTVGRDALDGRHPFQFFADSATYHDIYSGFVVSPEGMIGVSYNFLGPIWILTATGGNIYLVMIVNMAMFFFSMMYISRAFDLDPVKSSFIQFLSPLTISSLLSVNKEIIVFPVLACLLCGYRYKSFPLVAAAVLLSILARWQLSVFCLILIALYFFRNGNRYVIILSLLVFISFAYYSMQDILAPVLENVESATALLTEGSGLFERLIDLQNDGLYFLVAPIKAAHLLFSLGLRFDPIVNPINIYNDQVVGAYCFVNLLFLVALIAKKRFVLSNDLIAISLVYLVVFALTPVYAPRYFYAVTVLWALALSSAHSGRMATPSTKSVIARA